MNHFLGYIFKIIPFPMHIFSLVSSVDSKANPFGNLKKHDPGSWPQLKMPNLPKYSFEILKSVCPGAAQRCQRRFVFLFFLSKGWKEEAIPLVYQPKEMHKLNLKSTFKFTQHSTLLLIFIGEFSSIWIHELNC